MNASTAFCEAYRKVVAQNKTDMDAWIKRLKRDGVKAAHPDDGWVDRKNDEVHLEYPNFLRKIEVGDRIALGTPKEYRIVTVTDIRKGRLCGMLHYRFVECGGD